MGGSDRNKLRLNLFTRMPYRIQLPQAGANATAKKEKRGKGREKLLTKLEAARKECDVDGERKKKYHKLYNFARIPNWYHAQRKGEVTSEGGNRSAKGEIDRQHEDDQSNLCKK